MKRHRIHLKVDGNAILGCFFAYQKESDLGESGRIKG